MSRKSASLCGLFLGFTLGSGAAWANQPTEPSQASGPSEGSQPAQPSQAEGESARGQPSCEDPPKVVTFRKGSTKLSESAKARLDDVASWTKQEPTRMLQLRGQTDTSGSPAANARLKEKRAEAVRSYLATRGVDPVRMITQQEEGGEAEGRRAVEVMTCTAAPIAQAPATTPAPAEAPAAAPPPAPAPPVVVEAPPAQPPQVIVAPVPTPSPMPEADARREDRPASLIGIGAMVGGGVMGFVDDQTRAFADTGGTWEARFSAGTRTPFAIEAAYVGSSQGLTALGLNDAILLANGGEGAIRLNLTRQMVQPYIFGGAGWTRFHVMSDGANMSNLRTDDDVLTVPFGVGLSVRLLQGLILDIRGTGRATFMDDMMDAPYAATGQDARLHTWNALGRLGWEF